MAKRTMDDFKAEQREQLKAAWERSAEVRAENKLVRLMLKNKQLDGYDLIAGRLDLDDPDVVKQLEAIVSRWRIDKVIRAVPGMGATRTQEVLSIFSASPRQRLGALTMERRLELSRLVRAAVEIT